MRNIQVWGRAWILVAALVTGVATAQQQSETGSQVFRVGSVYGGKPSNPAWQIDQSNTEFSEVLTNYLKDTGRHSDSAEQVLNVNLLSARAEGLGLNTRVDTTIQYILKDDSQGQVVTVATVEATYRATLTESLRPSRRAKIAYRGAAIVSLNQFLEQLKSGATLQSSPEAPN